MATASRMTEGQREVNIFNMPILGFLTGHVHVEV